ncbi:MAG: SURF1 family protein [Rhodothalassiaceae bacterium]
MRTERRSGLLKALIIIAAFAVLIALGIWQLERLAWKKDLLARIAAQQQGAIVDLPDRIGDPAALEWRRVRLRGHFDHDRELHLVSGRGYLVVTPLLRPDAEPVLVVRGFVTQAKLSPDARREGLVAGEIELVGVVRLDEKPNAFLPANDPARNQWFHREAEAMAGAMGLAHAAPLFVTAIEDAPGGWPKAVRVDGTALPNNHLSYAITWFGLAAALLVILLIRLAGARRTQG